MSKENYTSPMAESLEILLEQSVAASDPATDGTPSFEGMKKDEEDWSK